MILDVHQMQLNWNGFVWSFLYASYNFFTISNCFLLCSAKMKWLFWRSRTIIVINGSFTYWLKIKSLWIHLSKHLTYFFILAVAGRIGWIDCEVKKSQLNLLMKLVQKMKRKFARLPPVLLMNSSGTFFSISYRWRWGRSKAFHTFH